MSEEYPPVGHPLQKLAARLTELLDEDYWAECEVLLLEAWNTRPDSKSYKWKDFDEWELLTFRNEKITNRALFNAAREKG